MKKRITKKRIKEFIGTIANINEWESSPGQFSRVYESKFDGSYITHVGMNERFKFFLKYGITEQLQTIDNGRTTCVGFNPEEQKWYGWSHRAVFGFGIGSTCKQGDCHFNPSNKEEFITAITNFWVDEYTESYTIEEGKEDGYLGIKLRRLYNNNVPNASIRGTINEIFEPYPSVWGRGEWVAETLADAKIMAQDFARGVS